MGNTSPLARKRQKKSKAPIIIIIALIAAAVIAVGSFFAVNVYNSPNTLSEKLTRVVHGEAYDDISQYYQSNGALGYSWKDDDRNRTVFYENGTGYIRFRDKEAELTDGKTNIDVTDHRLDFEWNVDESSKVLTIKADKDTLVYNFVANSNIDVKADYSKKNKSEWIVTDSRLGFNGFVYSAPEKTTFWSTIKNNFNSTFIIEDRWQSLLSGLGITLLIALCSTLLGLLLGFLLAIVRSTYDMTLKGKSCFKPSDYVLKVLNAIANIYITVIRGTPVVVQLMIMYFIIFASWDNGILAAILAFGINSGAYVAEIVRSGIMSIDKGQFEASRSLGFDYKSTMLFIILPQALKNVLPALGNEFIVLLKETSVAGYVAIVDLTKASDIIRSRTYEPFFPLITIAIIYLILVLILSFFLKKLERRLRNSDH